MISLVKYGKMSHKKGRLSCHLWHSYIWYLLLDYCYLLLAICDLLYAICVIYVTCYLDLLIWNLLFLAKTYSYIVICLVNFNQTCHIFITHRPHSYCFVTQFHTSTHINPNSHWVCGAPLLLQNLHCATTWERWSLGATILGRERLKINWCKLFFENRKDVR